MKKIVIAYCLVGLDGGVGNLLLNYLDHMDLTCFEIRIIAQDVSSILYKTEYEKRGFRVIKVCSKRESVLKNLKQLYKALEGADIVHAHMTLTNFFPLLVAWKLGIKNRISHSHLSEEKTVKTNTLAFLTRVVATNYWACGINAGKFLYGNKKFKIINNAIELKKYKFDESVRNAEREKYGIEDNCIVIGHVGRFTEQKNHKFLINIFEKVLKINPNYKLFLIGEGEKKEEIFEYAQKLKIDDKIIFTGAISDVNRMLQIMDIFVLPSLFEGLPVSIIEAEATGLPCVISSNVTDEVCINKNIRILSLEDTAEEWAQNVINMSQEKRIITQKELVVAGFNIEEEANKLQKIYLKMGK